VEDIDISESAKKAGQYYEAFSMVSEKTYAKFIDDQGNEMIIAEESYKLTYEAIWQKTSKLPVDPVKSEAKKLDEILGDWGSDEVSGRIVQFAEAVFNLMNTDERYSDLEQRDPKKFFEWAKNNVMNGFSEALSMLKPFIKDNDPLKEIIQMTYDKTMKGLEERFAPKSEEEAEEPSANEKVSQAYYQRTGIEYEKTFIKVDLTEEI